MYPGLFKLAASESFIWLFLHFLRNRRPFLLRFPRLFSLLEAGRGEPVRSSGQTVQMVPDRR